MITTGVSQAVPVQVLTWLGDQAELAEFTGDKFVRVDGDTAVCLSMRGFEVRLSYGDHVVRSDAAQSVLFLTSDSGWYEMFTAAGRELRAARRAAQRAHSS